MRLEQKEKEMAFFQIKMDVYAAMCYVKRGNSLQSVENTAKHLKITPSALKRFFITKEIDYEIDFKYLMGIIDYIIDNKNKNRLFKSFKRRLLLIEHNECIYELRKELRVWIDVMSGKKAGEIGGVEDLRKIYAQVFDFSQKIREAIDKISLQ